MARGSALGDQPDDLNERKREGEKEDCAKNGAATRDAPPEGYFYFARGGKPLKEAAVWC